MASAIVLSPNAAFAHPSLAPHEHPHGASALPDYYVLLIAAAVVGIGYVVRHVWKRR